MSEKRGLGSVARIDLDLVEAHKQVDGGEEPRAGMRRPNLVDSREGKGVLLSLCVDVAVVDAHSHRAVFFGVTTVIKT